MAINPDSKMKWEDIVELFTNLETARAKFFPNQSTIEPEKGGQYEIILRELAEILNAHINSFQSNKYVGDTANTDVTISSSPGLIDTSIFQRFTETVDRIVETCAHDSSYNGSYNSGYNSSYRGSYDSSNNSSYRGSYDSSNNSSYRGSYDSSDNSSYNASYNSSNNTSWCTSWRYEG